LELLWFFYSALVLLFTGTALAISTNLSASSDVEIYAFDQKPAGKEEKKNLT
jgi:hypothetical protein